MPSSSSSPPYDRLLHIVNALNAHRNVTAAVLAGELGVSERTVKRYISYMRNSLEMEIIWEPTSRAYYCDRPYDYLPLLRVTGDEALSLALAGKTFAAWQGTALGRALDSVLVKVGQVVGGAVSVPVSEIQSLISTPQIGCEDDREHRCFGPILEAIRLRRELKIRYKKPSAKRSENRILWPLHLAYLDHHWVLVTWDAKKQEARKFLLSRMDHIERTGVRFTPPPEFNVQAYLRDSFGLFTGEQVFAVSIRFDATAAPYIRERQWQASQQIEEKAGGGLIASYGVNHLLDVQRWVLSWGSHAEVLEPGELKQSIRSELKELCRKYQ